MLYTIGHTQNYIKALKENGVGSVYKCYGGYAFKTEDDAAKMLEALQDANSLLEALSSPIDWSIWLIDAKWENTTQADNGWWHLLDCNAFLYPIPGSESERTLREHGLKWQLPEGAV